MKFPKVPELLALKKELIAVLKAFVNTSELGIQILFISPYELYRKSTPGGDAKVPS